MHCVNIKHFRRDSLTSALRRLLIGSNTGKTKYLFEEISLMINPNFIQIKLFVFK